MAQLNTTQIERVAEVLKNMPDSDHGMNFYSFPGKNGKEIVADDMMGINPPLTPVTIVRRANDSSMSLNSFLCMMMHVHGFNKDILH